MVRLRNTLKPEPYALTLNPKPQTLKPEPYALTLNPKPQTLKPEPYASEQGKQRNKLRYTRHGWGRWQGTVQYIFGLCRRSQECDSSLRQSKIGVARRLAGTCNGCHLVQQHNCQARQAPAAFHQSKSHLYPELLRRGPDPGKSQNSGP